jgi:hypothetical protein
MSAMGGDPTLDVDGLPMDEVGAWAKDKHDRLRKYIGASAAARRKFLTAAAAAPNKRVAGVGGATYIDLFCATGRSLIVETGERIDGSPLIAHRSALASKAPFTSIHVADLDARSCHASYTRLRSLGADVTHHVGPAADTVGAITRAVNPQLVRGGKNQRLYWLAFVSRNSFAAALWEKIRRIDKQQEMFS